MAKNINWVEAIAGLAIVVIPIAPPFDDVLGLAMMADAFGVKI